VRHGRRRFIAGFLAVPLLLYVVFVISPYIQAFQISLTNWRGVSANPQYVGLENFRRLLGDDVFWTALRHNALLLLVLPLVTIVIALFFSFLLTSGGRRGGIGGSKFYRVVFFLPQVLAVAVIAVLFQTILKPDRGGMINGPLLQLGLQPIGFLTEPRLALWSIMGVLVWQAVGFYVVLFCAGMSSIPAELYESAQLDGASRPQLFFQVTLPLLRDTLQVAWVYLGVVALDAFAVVWVLSVDRGGPDRSTVVMATEIYRNAFVYSRFGYAAALGVALFFLSLTFAALTLRLTRRERIEFS
jgi:N-acetylglucosamine transport system permease protein